MNLIQIVPNRWINPEEVVEVSFADLNSEVTVRMSDGSTVVVTGTTAEAVIAQLNGRTV